MKRRELLQRSAAFGLAAVIPAVGKLSWHPGPSEAPNTTEQAKPAAKVNSLTPPAEGSIPVAFLISDGAVVIDFAGPWEVFGNVMVRNRMNLFHCYNVAETLEPILASGGMKIIPDYTLETAPAPRVLVIPAQGGASKAMLEWIRKSAKSADVTMSVCTGAFLLAETGLLAGKAATTHHGELMNLEMSYPDIHVKRGARFVEAGNLASSGGLSSGIDLAFRVVERYYGREVAKQTANNMEYQGQGWMNPDSNAEFAKVPASTDEHPRCAVCGMDVDVASAPKSGYKGKTYYFCIPNHKEQFDAAPERVISAIDKP